MIYRRIDDEFLDPLQFKPDSVLGVAGLLNAARAGNVVIANAVGNGVADDKLVYTYVPDMIRYYLGEKPLLPNVDTYRCWLDDERAARAGPARRAGAQAGGGLGRLRHPLRPQRHRARARRMRARRSATTRGAGSPSRSSSCRPCRPRSTTGSCPATSTCGPFAVNDGERVFVLPGGLTRVALPEGSLVVNSSQGGGTKDTWVLAAGRAAGGRARAGRAAGWPRSPPPARRPPSTGPELTHRPASNSSNSSRRDG